MKKPVLILSLFLYSVFYSFAQPAANQQGPFVVKGFHLDLRVQVMTMDALETFALKLHGLGINTLIMEWEGTYPFEKHPLISNRYAYTREQVVSFVKYCNGLGDRKSVV